MKFSTAVFSIVAIAVGVQALPFIPTNGYPRAIKRWGGGVNGSSGSSEINDYDILNFALFLEHLEVAFYTEGLAKYDDQDFADDGYSPSIRPFFEQIAEHEQSHVDYLTAALGDNAIQSCTYNFTHNNPTEFAKLSAALEITGISAYSGASRYISNGDYVDVASVILSTEARQATWVSSVVLNNTPWSGSFDVSLDLNEIITIASTFVVSCPASNPVLPANPFAPLSFIPSTNNTKSSATPGTEITFVYDYDSYSGEDIFAVFFTGLQRIHVPVSSDGVVLIPKELRGVVFVVLTTSATKVSDDVIIAGTVTLDFEFDAEGDFVV